MKKFRSLFPKIMKEPFVIVLLTFLSTMITLNMMGYLNKITDISLQKDEQSSEDKKLEYIKYLYNIKDENEEINEIQCIKKICGIEEKINSKIAIYDRNNLSFLEAMKVISETTEIPIIISLAHMEYLHEIFGHDFDVKIKFEGKLSHLLDVIALETLSKWRIENNVITFYPNKY